MTSATRSGQSRKCIERLLLDEGVSKLEMARFSGGALPFPKGRDADAARSDESIFAPEVEAARFDRPSAEQRPQLTSVHTEKP